MKPLRQQGLCGIVAYVPGGADHEGLAVFLHRLHALDPRKRLRQLLARGLRAHFKPEAALLLHLLAQLADLAAGDQLSVDEDAHAVADLLDLVKLV